jgi:Tol biopolymer transport system component/heat shock protein HslJ
MINPSPNSSCSARGLAWGIAALLLVIIVAWAIEELIPSHQPGQLQPVATSSAADWSELEVSRWQLSELEGLPVLERTLITLNFEDGQAGGSSGCNSYSWHYPTAKRSADDVIIEVTVMACEDVALMEQEERYLQALEQAASYRSRGDRLEIQDASGKDMLLYIQAPPPSDTPDLSAYFGQPGSAMLIASGQERESVLGTYTWTQVEKDGSTSLVHADAFAILTQAEPLSLESPIQARLRLPVPVTPSQLDLELYIVTDLDSAPANGDTRRWNLSSGEQIPLPLENDPQFSLNLDTGLYVLHLQAVWEGLGDASYGFLLEIRGEQNQQPAQNTSLQATRLEQPYPPLPDDYGGDLAESISPDGLWKASSINMGSGDDWPQKGIQRFTVSRTDESLIWEITVERILSDIGITQPNTFSWSPDGRWLYFTSRVDGGCSYPWGAYGGLYRLELQSGALTFLNPYPADELGMFSISPDSRILAYFQPVWSPEQVILHHLETGQETFLSFETPFASSWTVAGLVWAPQGDALAVTLQSGPCDFSRPGPLSFVVATLPGGPAKTIILEDDDYIGLAEWFEPGILKINTKNGRYVRVDAELGQQLVERVETPIPPPAGLELGWLTFISTQDGFPARFSVHPDGSGLQRTSGDLTLVFEVDPFYARILSPDGQRLAYQILVEAENDEDLFVSMLDGSGRIRLTASPEVDAEPVWSPDGKRIAFVSYRDGQRELYWLEVPATPGGPLPDAHRVTYTEHDWEWGQVWSPDGEWLAYMCTPKGFGSSQVHSDICIIQADGNGFRRLTDDQKGASSLAWSPDGRRLAFISDRDLDEEVYIIDADGSNQRQLTFNETNYYHYLTWSPDSACIAYVSALDESNSIYITRANEEPGEWFVGSYPILGGGMLWTMDLP